MCAPIEGILWSSVHPGLKLQIGIFHKRRNNQREDESQTHKERRHHNLITTQIACLEKKNWTKWRWCVWSKWWFVVVSSGSVLLLVFDSAVIEITLQDYASNSLTLREFRLRSNFIATGAGVNLLNLSVLTINALKMLKYNLFLTWMKTKQYRDRHTVFNGLYNCFNDKTSFQKHLVDPNSKNNENVMKVLKVILIYDLYTHWHYKDSRSVPHSLIYIHIKFHMASTLTKDYSQSPVI